MGPSLHFLMDVTNFSLQGFLHSLWSRLTIAGLLWMYIVNNNHQTCLKCLRGYGHCRPKPNFMNSYFHDSLKAPLAMVGTIHSQILVKIVYESQYTQFLECYFSYGWHQP